MKICATPLFEQQLKAILQIYAQEDLHATKQFKIYLDTIIINMPTKAKKYKQSLYFEDENIKDIIHQGWRIPFFMDEKKEYYLLLGIVKDEQIIGNDNTKLL